MKVADCLRLFTISISLLVLGCGPDVGMIDPPAGSEALQTNLASERFSEWSPPRNLDPPDAEVRVNSSATDQHPTLSKTGLSLYFASNRTGDQNIYVAQRDCVECSWNRVQPVDAVNSPSLDASPALSRDEHWLFFASQRRGNAPRWDGDRCASAPCDRDLWVSYREDIHNDLAWQRPVNLGPPVNTNGEEVAPSYFENDDSGLPQLFFNDGVVTAGVLSQGNIYVSELSPDGTWGARSEVTEVNTPEYSDQRPSISHDGLKLYFHSTRPLTPGGASGVPHLWVATRQLVSDPWSIPTLWPTPGSDVPAIHPFIHSHGQTETLLLVRGGDIWMSERTRSRAQE
jgi:hypothetical protein